MVAEIKSFLMSNKEIEKAIKIIWSSLKSHTGKNATDFDRECVKEYAYVIQVLSKCLKKKKK